MQDEDIVCPTCARAHASSERFCEACGMPLVHADGGDRSEIGQQAGERRRQARKIKPEYADGPLVKIAQVGSQPEAELVAGLLLEEGIPSMLRRAGGFDVAEFLAAGPRDVLVPESGAQAAREALAYKRD
jgi:hypothetical protein